MKMGRMVGQGRRRHRSVAELLIRHRFSVLEPHECLLDLPLGLQLHQLIEILHAYLDQPVLFGSGVAFLLDVVEVGVDGIGGAAYSPHNDACAHGEIDVESDIIVSFTFPAIELQHGIEHVMVVPRIDPGLLDLDIELLESTFDDFLDFHEFGFVVVQED